MRIRHCLIPALLALALIPGAPQAAEREPVNRLSPPAAERPARVERTHRLIVRYADGTRGIAGTAETSGVDAATHARQQATQLGAQMGESMRFVRHASGRTQVLALPEPRAIAEMEALAARLTALPEVEYAEPDRRRYIMVNDPRFPEQWHYHDPGPIGNDGFTTEGSANVEAGWAITTGSGEVTVAVLDTGILPHADIASVVTTYSGRLVPGFDMVSESILNNDNRDVRTANPLDPGDFVTESESSDEDGLFHGCPTFSSWHGTHVSGTIGALTDNDFGVAGIDHNARILPVRVLGKCFGQSIDIIDGIRWAAGLEVPEVQDNENPAHIINLSLGGEGECSTAEQQAIDDARAAGAIVIAAAGNQSELDGTIADVSNISPANCDGVITVAALARDGSRAFYSNAGELVDIAAPGGEAGWPPGVDEAGAILSTSDGPPPPPIGEGNQEADNDDDFAWQQGTSMAAPHVAGVLALVLALNPELTGAQAETLLLNNAREFPPPNEDPFDCTTDLCGEGIVDAELVLTAVLNGNTTPSGFTISSDPDSDIMPGDTINLTASGVPGEAGESYRWLQARGLPGSFTDPEDASTAFEIPEGTGPVRVQFRVTSSEGLAGYATLDLDMIGFQPSIGEISPKSVRRGTTLEFDVPVTHPNGPDGYTLSHSITPYEDLQGTISLIDDVFRWENTGPAGEYELTLTAEDVDDTNLTDSTTVAITVRSKPGSSSNFFGCTSASGARPDPLFALMLLIAMGWIVARAKRGPSKV